MTGVAAPESGWSQDELRVLIIDDNPDDRALVLRVVQQSLGSQIISEILDQKAVDQALADRAPDLVITDYQLRWSDGRTILERFKAAFPETPVVMFTGSGNEQLAADLIKGGLDDYVVKSPKYRARLETAVRSAIERRRAVHQMRAAHTRLHGLENQLRQSQKMEAIGLLAGGIAHDFNNLLTAIIGGAALLARRLDRYPVLQAEAHEIERVALRAADLTSQLLAFSRQQPLEPTAVNPNEVCRNVRRLLDRVIGEQIRVELRLEEPARPVFVDARQLEQVVLNLAINARDAMPEGGTLLIETATVTLDQSYATEHPDVRPGVYGVVAVSDTGTGMTPEIQARIFEPFFTTKGPDRGTGLGLSTVYGVIRQSGGHLAVSSEVGQGTTFRAYLPIATTELPVEHRPIPVSPPKVQARIVLVEDEPLVRAIARRALREAGYVVLEATGADQALAIFAGADQRIDLLITDVVMPGTSGPRLAEQLRADHPGLQVLFMSGHPVSDVPGQGVALPGEHFIQKPFTPDSLARAAAEVLRGRSLSPLPA